MTAAEIDAVLADFRAWLEAGGEPAAGPTDLLALAREVTALRHEVNLQTKATRAAVEKLTEPPPPPDPREVQRPLATALVDVADGLRTAQGKVRDVLRRIDPLTGLPPLPVRRRGRLGKLLFGLLPPAGPDLNGLTARWAERTNARVASLGDGYELSVKRVERALSTVGVEPIPTVGERFDPTTMEAVELADGGDVPSGTVLAESRRGYRWGGEVFRFARVTVAR